MQQPINMNTFAIIEICYLKSSCGNGYRKLILRENEFYFNKGKETMFEE